MKPLSPRKLFSAFLILTLIFQTTGGVLFLPKIEKAQASSGSWTQTSWTGGSGQSNWSDATKYNSITGEGIYNSTDLRMKINADVVIGQSNFTGGSVNQGGSVTANTLYDCTAHAYGTKLFVTDDSNNRVLIYNTIPTSNNAPADVVIGQQNFTSNSANQGGSPAANTLKLPVDALIINNKLIIADGNNHRVLIYNTIPTSNNASADVVIGQADFTHGSANRGGSPAANTLYQPFTLYSDGTKLHYCRPS